MHTPGPWQVVEATEHHGFYVVSDYGQTICDLYAMSRPDCLSTANGGPSKPLPFMHEMDGPNAHLIAAAPDLLAALVAAKEAVRQLLRNHTHSLDPEHYEAEELMDAALAKARGEA